MKRLRAWREGARAAIEGKVFAMNPHRHQPTIGWGFRRDPEANWWADGYWWAKENRRPTEQEDGDDG